MFKLRAAGLLSVVIMTECATSSDPGAVGMALLVSS
jgi:hypothetical protein